uniref:Integrase catalytic domain-containing protein n=1 Tax=Oryza brachyantha TaxID=4533 RepID=J3N1M4_ORYBR
MVAWMVMISRQIWRWPGMPRQQSGTGLSETQEIFKKFTKREQNESDVKIKRVQSDNGGEFKNTQVEEFLEEEDIKHEFSAPYDPP